MKKENKGLVIIIYLIMLIIVIGGPIIAINENKEQNEIKKDNYHNNDDNYNKENKKDNESNKENEEDENINSLDTYLEKYKFTISKNDRTKLINSTNMRNCMSNEIYGAMFNEKIPNDFKLYYTINELIRFIGNETGNSIVGEIKITEKTLLENAEKIFASVELPENYRSELSYFGTYKLTCNKGICTFTQDTFGVTGITPINGYETKITELENTINAKVIYIDEEMLDYNIDTDIYKFNAKLYDKHNGTLIKTIEDYELNLSKDINVYDEFSPYYNNIDEYVYLFDEDNRLLTVSKNRLN